MFQLTNYWWLLIWIFVGGGYLTIFGPKRKEIVCGKQEWRWSVGSAILLVLPYIIWAGYRGNNFGDTGAYRRAFINAPNNFLGIPEYISNISKDKGFYALSAIIKSIIGESDVVYFLIIASIQILCIAFVCRKFSKNYWTSIFLFIASTEYLSWCHNGIRQFTAVALIFASTKWILQKKYIPVICIILLTSTLHGSAMLMLPIIFIVQGKAWNKKTILCILATIVVLVSVDQFTNLLDGMMENTQYSNMVTDWKEWEDDGTNPIRVLIYSIPMILSLVGLKQIRKEDNNFINIMVNFSILASAIALVSMVTSGIFIGRLIIYPFIFSMCLLLPWEIEKLFKGESAKTIKLALIVGYLGFFYFQMHFTWGVV